MPEMTPTADPAPAAGPALTDRVPLAMSAAPEVIGSGATIMDFDSTGALVELRAGTNGWMCLPDSNPGAPRNTPICVDGPWQVWFDAYMAGEAPSITAMGVSYMFQGDVVASNTDPLATAPPAGQPWIEDGPHIMVIVPDPAMLAGFSTNHLSGGPYVMWTGTPYAHLMVPVTPN